METNLLRKMKRLAYALCIGMFIVVMNGAVVTKTDSGDGCGTDWPLCEGRFMPMPTKESLIEFIHRLTTGMVGILVLVMVIMIWRYARKQREIVLYGSLTMMFTVIQAIMGALAVVYPQSPPVMALHFGFSLVAFASSFLLAMTLRRIQRAVTIPDLQQPKPVKDMFRYGVWFTLLYTYIVVYVGAFVSHTESAGGCMGWPLCNGEIIPDLSGGTLIAFLHRVAAGLLFVVVAAMAHFAYHHNKENREIQLCGIWALLLCLGQVLTGAMVVFSLTDETMHLIAGLLHAVFICGMFSVLVYMSVRVWQLRERR